MQMGKIGYASYHFDGEINKPIAIDTNNMDNVLNTAKKSSCFISFENAPKEWKCTDGSNYPQRKYFLNAFYDEDTRTFNGLVDWRDHPVDGGTTSWQYEMVFSEDF